MVLTPYGGLDRALGHKADWPQGPMRLKAQGCPGGPGVAKQAARAARAATPQGVDREKLKKSAFVMGASNAMNSRFSDMFKAFQYVDLDRSGRLSRDEIKRALDMWNVPLDDESLDLLLGDCDQDGDGGVSYEEFVDKLARGTVSNAAMGKRGMQSLEAMGVDSQEMLAEQLGHKKLTKFIPTVNG